MTSKGLEEIVTVTNTALSVADKVLELIGAGKIAEAKAEIEHWKAIAIGEGKIAEYWHEKWLETEKKLCQMTELCNKLKQEVKA